MKAVILTRVSTKEQEEGHSLPAQSTRLSEYAKRKNLTVIQTFQIIESSTRGKRKEFMQMIDFCKSYPEKIAIIADAVDRVQRSFKESVMLDDLIRQEKIELHFYRENMVIGKNSSSSDIMRWDFSVMGAKSYVLQLSENVRRSIDYKTKNGELSGAAPTGYENFIDENGKHSIRLKEPDATKIRLLFERYSLGGISIHELARYADSIGLKSRTGKKIVNTTLTKILDNPFYYGEMNSKGRLIRHIYEPIITKELFDQCQIWRGKTTSKPFKHGDIPFLYRGLITCMNSGKTCPNEIKKKKFYYLVCYRQDGTRLYIPEQDITDQIEYILGGIHIPEQALRDLKTHLINSKSAEIEFRNREIGRLNAEITRAQQRLDTLLNMRLDGELSKEQYEDKKAELQLNIERSKDKLKAHGKADDDFNETLIGLFEIASASKELFHRSKDINQKRLLMRFIFESLQIKEGTIYYKLNFPFSEMEMNSNSGGNHSEPLSGNGYSGKTGDSETSQNTSIRTIKNEVKTKACDQKSQACTNWLGWLDSNQRMTIPKTVALPLGDTPRKSCFMYRCAFETAEVYLCHIFHFGKSFFITLKMPTSRVGISPKKDRPPLIRELKQPQPDGLIMIKDERRYSPTSWHSLY